jgi:hypothetical protein
MAKKNKNAAPARTKRSKRPRKKGGDDLSKFQKPDEIVQFWLDSVNGKLKALPHKKKELTRDIVGYYRTLLEGYVSDHITNDKKEFTKSDEDITKRVATDLVKILKIVTTQSDTIEFETFELAFTLVQKRHDVCRPIFARDGTPRGAWCGGGARVP